MRPPAPRRPAPTSATSSRQRHLPQGTSEATARRESQGRSHSSDTASSRVPLDDPSTAWLTAPADGSPSPRETVPGAGVGAGRPARQQPRHHPRHRSAGDAHPLGTAAQAAPAADVAYDSMAACASLGAKPPGSTAGRTQGDRIEHAFRAAGLKTSFEDFHVPIYDVNRVRLTGPAGAGTRHIASGSRGNTRGGALPQGGRHGPCRYTRRRPRRSSSVG
jgi:hypothetical protein